MQRAIRVFGSVLLWAVVALCCAIIVVPRFLDRIYYEGPASPHFDTARFFNPDGEDTAAPPTGGSRTNFFVRYFLQDDGRPLWPTHVAVTPSKPAARVDGQRMVVTWIGHATVLIQTQGLNILTDPIWANTSGPYGFGPRRVTEPGVRFVDLPKIDVVLISHDHYDHMSLPMLRQLWGRDKPLIITSLGNDKVMAGVKSVARDWGGRVNVRPGIDVIVTRNHHWGTRFMADRNRALWSSFVVTLPGGNLFFAGDTGFGDGKWPAEARAYGPIRLALLPIGAFRFLPGQMSIASHIGPIDAAEVFQRLGASRAIAIHWGTFRLSYEARDTPPKLLDAVMKCRTDIGGGRAFTAVAPGVATEVASMLPEPAMAAPVTRDQVIHCLDTPQVRALR
ncbi:Zn-dependent hydrolase [Sphingomonas paeninsulae]|uniref:Zn-dependent hydrolase n=1 Tax=Sphingomonas paeninsulae TaxID=2319844 RepID=A0A494TC04_SPHPE|nr:MBL fold metallo-hydrolase [Sphingomonas paeninsulae]AYJ86680.1 Zn-dependent hydrolase [Sphingomonas paeninsulae]